VTDPERPFRALHRPSAPVDPDPRFAAELRDRLRRALLTQRAASVPPRTPDPAGGAPMTQLTPYLVVRDARAAMSWYADALGARLVGDPYVSDDDRIGHAELDIGGATLYLADEHPELGLTGPDIGRVSVSLHLAVPDVDGAVARAAAAGATVEREPADAPYGRIGVVVDPFGHRWMLLTAAGSPPASRPPMRSGDTVYLTLRVPDGARARDFYEAVLGWSMSPGRVEDGWEDQAVTPMVGIGGGQTHDLGAVPMYAVDDIEVAVAAVRTAGGQAGEIERQSYGLSAYCRDDQGLPFWLGQMS
jgi:uncharacterized glyoxalase superfamily protein PhnB